ncbi:hypothetical protein HY933_00955 [Candidatus Falkowbacteria bacterium]|nr:hypothetical protein [Candidatus Falkowbacteria bacterium]
MPTTDRYTKNWLKFALGFVICVLIRLMPWRPANIEPILGTQMPFSKAYGALAGFLFAFFNIVVFDLLTRKLGVWTLLTAGTYGLLGLAAAWYFARRPADRWHYAKFAIAGTLFFDAVTGLSLGPLFFGQPLSEAFFGQIPFTARHLLGNLLMALMLSPLIYRFVIQNPVLEKFGQLKFLTKKS